MTTEVHSLFPFNVTNGVKIPIMTHAEVSFFFGVPLSSPLFRGERDREYDWVVPYLATRIELVVQFVDNLRIFHSWVNRSLETVTSCTDWESFVRNVGSEVNGQVKNFLVACRTASGFVGDKMRVLIRGSKSGSTSGIWQWMFADYLVGTAREVQIDCYDPCEVPTTEKRQYDVGGDIRNAEIRKYAQSYEGQAEGYDIAIDDAYDKDILPWSPVSPIWSLKDHREGQVPFLHPVESRVFSHEVRGQKSPCPCVVCRTISSFTQTYAQFVQLKTYVVLLGGKPCCHIDHADVLKAKGRIYRTVCAHPTVDLRKPSDIRGTLSLMTDVRLKVVGSTAVSLVSADSSKSVAAFQRSKGFCVLEETSRCPRLEKKNVHFLGIDPSILGKTETSSKGPIIYFCRTAEQALSRNMTTEELWCLDDAVVGYEKTGHEWSYFSQFVRIKSSDLPPVVGGSTYSVLSGVDVRSHPDLSWTKYVPASYLVRPDQWDGEFTDFVTNKPYALARKFSYERLPSGDFRPLQIEGLECAIVLEPLENYRAYKVECRGGVSTVSFDPKCAFSRGVPQCGHDHIRLIDSRWLFFPHPKYQSAQIDEGSFTYTFRGPVVDHEELAKNYARYRSTKKVVIVNGRYTVIPSSA